LPSRSTSSTKSSRSRRSTGRRSCSRAARTSSGSPRSRIACSMAPSTGTPAISSTQGPSCSAAARRVGARSPPCGAGRTSKRALLAMRGGTLGSAARAVWGVASTSAATTPSQGTRTPLDRPRVDSPRTAPPEPQSTDRRAGVIPPGAPCAPRYRLRSSLRSASQLLRTLCGSRPEK